MKNRIMLGLRDSKENTHCDYEQRSVMTGQKASKPKENLCGKKKVPITSCVVKQEPNSTGKILQEKENQKSTISVEDQMDKQNKEKIDQQNSVTFFNSSEQNEENSKAFIESLGSWINDLFNVPNKCSQLSSTNVRNEFPKESILEEDPEYLKSISAIKEQFRKKLKSETSIQLSAPDKPFAFNFDKDLDSSKKNKKSAKSLPPSPSTDWIEELNDLEEQIAETSENCIRRYNPNFNAAGLIIRTNDIEDSIPPFPKAKSNVKEFNGLILTKKRKTKGRNRQDITELEEYIFPTPSELSKRILLTVNENDKCGQFYKNSHLGVQESQHYGQRKSSKSHQTIARCYTTNANPTDSSRISKLALPESRFSQYCTTSASIVGGANDVLRRNSMEMRRNHLRKPTKKEMSEISRDSMTFLKVKPPKLVRSLQMESTRSDPKTSSDELVRYLMKKIKTTRPHHLKKKGSVPQLLGNTKSRFMQSATNTLVSVMSKKEENQLPAKSIPRVFTEPRLYPSRELILKNSDTNIRVDVSRAISTNKFSRLSYLLDDNKVEDDAYLLDRSSFGNTKRPYEDILKREMKKHGNKFNKRQEVRNMLSKIDARFNVFQTGKQKEHKRGVEDIKEEQNARFQKQHEQFKTNLKLMQQTAESQETKNDAETEVPSFVSTELAVIDTGSQSASHPLQPKYDVTEPAGTTLEQNLLTATPTEADCKIDEFLHLDRKTPRNKAKLSAEKSMVYRDKTPKTKSVEFLKETNSKTMLDPLEKLYNSEQNPRDTAKPQESLPLCPVEFEQVNLADNVLLNPRCSNSLVESSPKSKPSSCCSPPIETTLFLSETEKDMNGDKREVKDKKKVKTPKITGTRNTNVENACGFDKVKKKPGPNCEKEE